jgi:hypothetical protein
MKRLKRPMDNQFEKNNNKERKRTDALDVMFLSVRRSICIKPP